MIKAGHPPGVVWKYTLRQAIAFLKLEESRKREENAMLLSLLALGSRGEIKDVEKQIREWMR